MHDFDDDIKDFTAPYSSVEIIFVRVLKGSAISQQAFVDTFGILG